MPGFGARLVSALPHGRLAPTVQTMAWCSAQRNTVVAIATLAGRCMANSALTAGTSFSGIGRVVSSVPTRLHYAEIVSACAIVNHSVTGITATAVTQDLNKPTLGLSSAQADRAKPL